MNPEIEKLIDHALADCKLTEKEKEVILRKAEKLGEDVDEVEIILDAKFHELQNKPKLPKEKHGNIKTCPACGEPIESFQIYCASCGHEFTSIAKNISILELVNKIDTIESEKLKTTGNLKATERLTRSNDFEMRKIELITNFPIPNTKEDILEFLAYSVSKGTNSMTATGGIGGAWNTKAKEIIIKARILFKNDTDFNIHLNELERKLKQAKRGGFLIIIVSIIIIMAIALLVMIFGGRLK
jgi:hypothetical protein